MVGAPGSSITLVPRLQPEPELLDMSVFRGSDGALAGVVFHDNRAYRDRDVHTFSTVSEALRDGYWSWTGSFARGGQAPRTYVSAPWPASAGVVGARWSTQGILVSRKRGDVGIPVRPEVIAQALMSARAGGQAGLDSAVVDALRRGGAEGNLLLCVPADFGGTAIAEILADGFPHVYLQSTPFLMGVKSSGGVEVVLGQSGVFTLYAGGGTAGSTVVRDTSELWDTSRVGSRPAQVYYNLRSDEFACSIAQRLAAGGPPLRFQHMNGRPLVLPYLPRRVLPAVVPVSPASEGRFLISANGAETIVSPGDLGELLVYQKSFRTSAGNRGRPVLFVSGNGVPAGRAMEVLSQLRARLALHNYFRPVGMNVEPLTWQGADVIRFSGASAWISLPALEPPAERVVTWLVRGDAPAVVVHSGSDRTFSDDIAAARDVAAAKSRVFGSWEGRRADGIAAARIERELPLPDGTVFTFVHGSSRGFASLIGGREMMAVSARLLASVLARPDISTAMSLTLGRPAPMFLVSGVSQRVQTAFFRSLREALARADMRGFAPTRPLVVVDRSARTTAGFVIGARGGIAELTRSTFQEINTPAMGPPRMWRPVLDDDAAPRDEVIGRGATGG